MSHDDRIGRGQDIQERKRKLVLIVTDHCGLPFTDNDRVWMARTITKALDERFDLVVDDVVVEEVR